MTMVSTLVLLDVYQPVKERYQDIVVLLVV